jgi:hypothetical protein
LVQLLMVQKRGDCNDRDKDFLDHYQFNQSLTVAYRFCLTR